MGNLRTTLLMVFGVLGCAGRVAPLQPMPVCDADARRWAPDPGNATRNLRVWIDAPAQTLDGWQSYGWRRLRVAMAEWNSVRLPVRLVDARSPRDSDIIVDIIETIPGQDTGNRDQAGLTSLTYEGGVITRARVFVAVSAPFGVRYRLPDQVATLIHELGHALGLPHATETKAMMSARRQVKELTGADFVLARRHFYCAAPGS